MKYFIDTEFIEDGKTIDLISIGIVSEDGREYYAVNCDCDFEQANDWVIENVFSSIGISVEYDSFKQIKLNYNNNYYKTAKPKYQIALEIIQFIKNLNPTKEAYWKTFLYETETGFSKPEFWGYYSSYDWVVFCQLFGRMIDLPKGFSMYCNDIKQLCNSLGDPKLPEQTSAKHNALNDAKWNKEIYDFLIGLNKN